jgi:hypothetical protein
VKKFIASAVLIGLALSIGAKPAEAATPKPAEHLVVVKLYPDGGKTTSVDGKLVQDTRAGKRDAVAAGPYRGTRFAGSYICLWNQIGTTWDIGGAGNAWEGTNSIQTGYRSAAQGCGGYNTNQHLRFSTYSEGDGACSALIGYSASVGPYAYYNEQWTATGGGPRILMNTYYYAALGCRDTVQHRNNSMSRAQGLAFGMQTLDNPYTASVMNDHFQDSYNFAGAVDRNNAWSLYNCPGVGC